MANSLFTGVAGLQINQTMLDVVGNNLANSNTTGFKGQRVLFSDLVYQTIDNATSTSGQQLGGTNPVQVGLGARVASVDANLQQGSIETTGRDLDMAIQGNGFFVARNGAQNVFTRDGAFGIDSSNYLVDPATGFRVQRYGTVGEGSATAPAFQSAGNGDIQIPIGTGIPGQATSDITLSGNLSASAKGPQAQALISAQALVSGGAPATTATLLNALSDSLKPYVAGDSLQLSGVNANNVAVNATLNVNGTTTVGDLINAINADFAGATASLDSRGNLVVKAINTGPTKLSVSIVDASTNTGGMSWGNHTFSTTTVGQNGDMAQTGIQVYDLQGTPHNVSLLFQKQADNTWDLTASTADGTMSDNLVSGITFNSDGSFRQVSGTGIGDQFISVQWVGMPVPQKIKISLGSANGFDGVTQVGGPNSAVATGQDGFAAGFLNSLSMGQDGVISGVFTNGKTLPIAQIAIAKFANPSALSRLGNNYLGLSSESGPALLGAGLSGGRGSIQSKSLESSNVDVAQEFTNLIIAQRGYQVNARVITASDQVLQELANILH